MHKSKYWEDTFEDSMDLVAKLPVVAATIYNNLFRSVIERGQLHESAILISSILFWKVLRFSLAYIQGGSRSLPP